ncbi:MAG: hypothetical protein ACI87E_000259 [Mariniblastus sp.]|jgi:hypothetical protein
MHQVIKKIAILAIAILPLALISNAANSAATANHCARKSASSASASSAACPFCSAIALTFSEQLESNDIAVVATLMEIPPVNNNPNADFPKATFEITQVLKGQKFVAEKMAFKTQLVGTYPLGQKFLVMGVDPPNVAWTTPMKASDRVFKYLNEIQSLPAGGPKRLEFFQDYFEDKESVLAFDAYDEFARAPYEDLLAMKDTMKRDELLGWIKDTDTSVSRRRLYFTMLGVCGKPEDAELLKEFIESGSRKKRAGLDALIACYLTLKGESGVDLIEKTFLADHDADYVDTLAAVSALRFHGTEVDIVPKARIVAAIRHLLDRPKMADMIIPDLARWKDWSVMPRLVKMFKEADEESNWLRVPVVTYLRACPKPEAKAYIEELRKIDPEAIQRADFFLGVGEGDGWGDDDSESDEKSPADKSDDDSQSDSKTTVSANELLPVAYVVKKVSMIEEPQATEDSQDNSDVQQTFATHADIKQLAAAEQQTQGTETVAVAIPASVEPALPSSPSPVSFVSTSADPSPESVAATQPSPQTNSAATAVAPVAAATIPNLTLWIILVPMGISVGILLLLLAVVNGWFERLIF